MDIFITECEHLQKWKQMKCPLDWGLFCWYYGSLETANERENELRVLIAIVTEYLKQTTKSCIYLLRNGLCKNAGHCTTGSMNDSKTKMCIIYIARSVTVNSLHYVNCKKKICTDHTSAQTSRQYLLFIVTAVRNSNLSYYVIYSLQSPVTSISLRHIRCYISLTSFRIWLARQTKCFLFHLKNSVL
jgi:hypothetical protein